jgi:hypothetical protein
MQRNVIRQGGNTGLNYLRRLYLQRHIPSVSRMRSHVMVDITQGRVSNPICNRQQLISLDFKNNILLCQKTRSCFFQVFPSQIPVESRNTHTVIKTSIHFHIHFRIYCGLNSMPTKVVSISTFRCIYRIKRVSSNTTIQCYETILYYVSRATCFDST